MDEVKLERMEREGREMGEGGDLMRYGRVEMSERDGWILDEWSESGDGGKRV